MCSGECFFVVVVVVVEQKRNKKIRAETNYDCLQLVYLGKNCFSFFHNLNNFVVWLLISPPVKRPSAGLEIIEILRTSVWPKCVNVR